MKILLDFDDVLADTSRVWLDELNRQHNTSVRWDETRDYDLRLSYPELEPMEIYRPYIDGTLYLDAHPFREAQRMVEELYAEGHELYVVTSNLLGINSVDLLDCLRSRGVSHTVDYLIEFLAEFYPQIRTEHIIIAANKTLIRGDALIDDNPGNLIRFQGLRILLDKPWNRNCETERYNICRVTGHEEALRVLREEWQ